MDIIHEFPSCPFFPHFFTPIMIVYHGKTMKLANTLLGLGDWVLVVVGAGGGTEQQQEEGLTDLGGLSGGEE